MEEEYTQAQTYEPTQQDSDFLRYRLDTKELIAKLELALASKKYIVIFENGLEKVINEQVSEPKINSKGLQTIMSRLDSVINNVTVQGNSTYNDYWDFIAGLREELAELIMLNLETWKVKESDYDYIVDTIMNTVKLFLSRTIDNKERDSYSKITHLETKNLGKRSALNFDKLTT